MDLIETRRGLREFRRTSVVGGEPRQLRDESNSRVRVAVKRDGLRFGELGSARRPFPVEYFHCHTAWCKLRCCPMREFRGKGSQQCSFLQSMQGIGSRCGPQRKISDRTLREIVYPCRNFSVRRRWGSTSEGLHLRLHVEYLAPHVKGELTAPGSDGEHAETSWLAENFGHL